MPKLLDISALPFVRIYKCKNGSLINMREFVEGLRIPINDLGTIGYIGQVTSLGFAMAKPLDFTDEDEEPDDYWDEPESYVWFVGGWGPQRDMYIANAVRKLRAMFREGLETLSMRLSPRYESFFEDVVDQIETNGNFLWGDFPWGGAVEVYMGDDLCLHGAVSCFDDDVDDDIVARLIVSLLAKRIINGG